MLLAVMLLGHLRIIVQVREGAGASRRTFLCVCVMAECVLCFHIIWKLTAGKEEERQAEQLALLEQKKAGDVEEGQAVPTMDDAQSGVPSLPVFSITDLAMSPRERLSTPTKHRVTGSRLRRKPAHGSRIGTGNLNLPAVQLC